MGLSDITCSSAYDSIQLLLVTKCERMLDEEGTTKEEDNDSLGVFVFA